MLLFVRDFVFKFKLLGAISFCRDATLRHHEDLIKPPPPTPEFLTKRIPVGNQVSNHSLSRENQVSLVRTFLSDPGSEGVIGGIGGWG